MMIGNYIKYVLPALSAILSLTAYSADDCRIMATVSEKETGEKCIGASCRIFVENDTVRPAVLGVTDETGRLVATVDKPGNYILSISYMGLKDAEKSFTVKRGERSVDLGDIKMERNEETLAETVVIGRRALVQSNGATLTYNVSEDPDASSNAVIEILRKVPMVTVDAEDNIKVKGQSNFKIYLNGKEDPMLSGDPKTLLKSMPASSIKKIEVITEPGAKFDAEGTGGILNIVTDTKQNLQGYLVNGSFNISNRHLGGSLYGRMKVGNVTGSVSFNYADGNIFKTHFTNRSESYNLISEDNYLKTTDKDQKQGWNYKGGNINLSWEPDTLNLFTFSASLFSNKYSSEGNVDTHQLTISGLEKWSLVQKELMGGKYLSSSVQLSYQHNFKPNDHYIAASYIFDYGINDSETTSDVIECIDYHKEKPYEKYENDSNLPKHTFQIDYTNRLSSHHLLEAGAKAILRRENGDTSPFGGMDSFTAVIDESRRVKLYQFQDIAALYASYEGTFGKWNFRAGLRYEFTHIGVNYKIGGYSDFASRMNDFVPNAAVSWKTGDASNLRLAYQMRISRPGLNFLNPYRNTFTPGRISYGNPDLKDSKSNNISLNYSNYGGKVGGSAGIYWDYVANGVADIIFSKDNLIHSTFANIGRNSSFGLYGNLNWQIVKDLDLGIYLGGRYVDYRADSEMLHLRKHGWNGNVNADINYMLPGKVRISAYGGGGTKWFDAQSDGDGWYYYGLGISRSFLSKDALTFRLSANNFIPAYRTSSWKQISETAIDTSVTRYPQWNVGFSVSFRIGGLTTDVKKTGAKIEQESSSASSKSPGNTPGN